MVKYIKENYWFEDGEDFTRDEINDFAYDVCDFINAEEEYEVELVEVYLTDGLLEMTVSVDDGEFEAHTEHKLDRRKARYGLKGYTQLFVRDLENSIAEQLGEWSETYD